MDRLADYLEYYILERMVGLDLNRAAYVLYGVKYIGPVSLLGSWFGS